MRAALVLLAAICCSSCWDEERFIADCLAAGRCFEPDGGAVDAGDVDAGDVDAGSPDAGSTDAGGTDAGVSDAGAVDGGFWNWVSVSAELGGVTASPDASFTATQINVASTALFSGGVLTLASTIVGVPFGTNGAVVIRLDGGSPVTGPPPVGAVAGGWSGGVLAADGYVYAAPRAANRFLRIDPVTGASAQWGDPVNDAGTQKFRGAILSGNAVYAIPFRAPYVAKLDLDSGVVTAIPLPAGVVPVATAAGHGNWTGGTLLSDGRIVMVPAYHTEVLLLDPATDSMTGLGPGEGYGGAAILPSGSFVGVPIGTDALLTGTPESFLEAPLGFSDLDSEKFYAAAWSTNGYLYACPSGVTYVLAIDRTGVATRLAWPGPTLAPSFQELMSIVGAPDGRLFLFAEWDAHSRIVVLTPSGRTTFSLATMTSPWINKL